MNRTKKILFTALLTTATIILGRILSVRTPIVTIGFSFVPIMLSAVLLGFKRCVFIATISDIIGALVFPSGSYFFGFTISSFLTGCVYGLLLYRKDFKVDKKFIIRLVISVLIVSLLIHGILNTIWIFIMTKGASKIIVPTRLIKELIIIPVKILTMLPILKIFEERIQNLLND